MHPASIGSIKNSFSSQTHELAFVTINSHANREEVPDFCVTPLNFCSGNRKFFHNSGICPKPARKISKLETGVGHRARPRPAPRQAQAYPDVVPYRKSHSPRAATCSKTGRGL